MSMFDDLPFQLLYVSDARAGIESRDLAAIATVSRERNLDAGISGALLFDGARFCQLIEGPELNIRSLMTRIGADSRHRNISIAAACNFALPRLTTRWQLGTCSAVAINPLVSAPPPLNEVALALFMSAFVSAAMF